MATSQKAHSQSLTQIANSHQQYITAGNGTVNNTVAITTTTTNNNNRINNGNNNNKHCTTTTMFTK
jgi:hypothetical protein